MGSKWGRYRVDVGSMSGRCGVDVASICSRRRDDVGSIGGLCICENNKNCEGGVLTKV